MTLEAADHLINTELLFLAQAGLTKLAGAEKRGFVPTGDPSMGAAGGGGAGGGGAPPGGDPSGGAGGMPPGSGGAPPPDAGGTGGGGGGEIDAKVQQAVQKAMMMMGGGAGGGGAGGPLKPKIDINVEIMKIGKILAMIADKQGVHIPASLMMVTSDDLMAMAQNQQNPGAATSMGGSNPAGGGPPSAIQPPAPMDPMQAAMPAAPGGAGGAGAAGGSEKQGGYVFDTRGLESIGNKAAAIQRLRRTRQAA